LRDKILGGTKKTKDAAKTSIEFGLPVCMKRGARKTNLKK
jgi:hypothetical protein